MIMSSGSIGGVPHQAPAKRLSVPAPYTERISSSSQSGTSPSQRRASLSVLMNPTVNCSKLIIKDGTYLDSKKWEDPKSKADNVGNNPPSKMKMSSEERSNFTQADETLPRTSPATSSSSPTVTSATSSSSSAIAPSAETAVVRPSTPVDERQMLAPDSTTSQPEGKQSFAPGDDVFVKQKDGRYYLGTVMRSSPGGERWLVRFGDETERWAGGVELRPLAAPSGGADDAAPLCVVCKLRGGAEVTVCDQCGRGYHRACHGPQSHCYAQGVSWQCRRCVDQRFKVAASENRALRREMLKMKQIVRPPDKLPYDINCLHWDPQHRTNTEKIYCYCGKPGDWFGQMLQCSRCRQWFHQRCISCLKYPLYTGDRFYVFACSLCNYGSEFVRRLEMKWVDLVHLMLFNLTAYNCKKYYDLDTVIIPYIMDNWYALQLPQKMQAVTPTQRRDQIISALTLNRNRFKCGREIKKRAGIWGLRARTPPPPPTLASPLPSRGPLTEQILATRLAFIPETDSPSSSQDSSSQHRMVVPVDNHWLSVMMGKRFQTSSNSSDNDSLRSTPSPSPIDLNPSPNLCTTNATARYNLSNHSHIFASKEREESPYRFTDEPPADLKTSSPPPKRKELKFYEMDFQGGGFVKKSVPFPKLTLNKRKKLLNSLKQRCKSKHIKHEIDPEKDEKFNRTKKMLRTRFAKQTVKTTSSIGTNTPPVEDESVFTLLENRSCSVSKDYDVNVKNEVILPPTPPTSVSAPPTPPAATVPTSSSSSNDVPLHFQLKKKPQTLTYDSDQDTVSKDNQSIQSTSSSDVVKIPAEKTPTKNKSKDVKKEKEPPSFTGVFSNGHNSKIAAINLEISKLSTKNIIEHSKIMSLHHMNDPYSLFKIEHDSSGDDTSSRGTLDSIIPPPANFQGKNNPFHLQANSSKATLSVANKLFNRHSLSKVASTSNTGNQAVKVQRISLPASLNPVIAPPAKPLKRQLSEKDLVIGPNGEVKRRRHRRPRKAVQQNQVSSIKEVMTERQKSLRSSYTQEDGQIKQQPALCQIVTGVSNENQQLNACMEYTPNGRCLRQRQEKNYSDSRRGSTSSNSMNILPPTATVSPNLTANSASSGVRSLNLSPQKMSPFKTQTATPAPSDSIHDLKTSVHSYFGAVNRIGAGEKFTLIGKRVTESGSVQYLIEWDGHGS